MTSYTPLIQNYIQMKSMRKTLIYILIISPK